MKTAPKPAFGTRVARSAIHADTRLGFNAICYFAEAVAPGFERLAKRRVALRSSTRWGDEETLKDDLECKIWSILAFFKPNRRYFLFLHLLCLWIGVKLIERHDPFVLSNGDLIIERKAKKQ